MGWDTLHDGIAIFKILKVFKDLSLNHFGNKKCRSSATIFFELSKSLKMYGIHWVHKLVSEKTRFPTRYSLLENF